MGLDNKAYTYYRILREINEIDDTHLDKNEIGAFMKIYSNPLMKPLRKNLINSSGNYLRSKSQYKQVEETIIQHTELIDARTFSKYHEMPKQIINGYEPLEDRLRILEDRLINDNLEIKMNKTSRRYLEIKNNIEDDRAEYMALIKIKQM